MTTPSPPQEKRYLEVAALIAVFMAGLSIRLFRLDNPALWLDEATTYSMASQPIERLFGDDIRIETSPPIYYILQHLWMYFGDERYTMRMLPVIFGTLTIPAAYTLAKPFLGHKTALLTAFLVATAPLFIHYSRELRSYSMLALFSTTTLASCVHLVHQNNAKTKQSTWPLWTLYIASCSLAIHSHNSAILFPALLICAAVILAALKEITPRFCVKWIGATLVGVATLSWWIPVIHEQTGGMMQNFWIPEPTFSVVKSNLLGIYPYPPVFKVIFFSAGLLGLFHLLKKSRILATISLVILLGQPLLLYLVSLYSPAFLVRALVWPSIFFFVYLAIAINLIKNKAWQLSVIALMVIVQLYSIRNEFPHDRETGAVYDLAPYLQPNSATDAILIAPQNIEWEMRYDLRKKNLTTPMFGLNYGDSGQILKNWMISETVDRALIMDRLDGYARIWLLIERNPMFPPSPEDDYIDTIEQIKNSREVVAQWGGGRYNLLLLQSK